jgi:hypothetical protein
MALKDAGAIRLHEAGRCIGGGGFPIWQGFEAAHKIATTAMPTIFNGPFDCEPRPTPAVLWVPSRDTALVATHFKAIRHPSCQNVREVLHITAKLAQNHAQIQQLSQRGVT